MMKDWISMDFGTSSSAVAVIRNLQPELATPLDSDAAGSKIFSTAVYVQENGNIAACHDAERMKDFDCSRFLREFKPDIHDGTIPDLGVSYVALVAAVLKNLKAAAEKTLGKSVENVVLTVPATYHESGVKQQVMLAAAREAGFKETEIIREAQAAAIYYDFIEQNPSGHSLVYDLGGGTFDAAIIRHAGTDYQLVGSSLGSHDTGGKFFTEKIIEHYISQTGTTIDYSDSALLDGILTKCEKIKRHLSNNKSGEFPARQGKSYTLTQKEFENMISADLDRTLSICNSLISNTGMEWKKINRVLLIGGSCNIPLVQSKIKSHLQSLDSGVAIWKETESGKPIDPQFAVALGAAVHAMKKYMAPPPVTIGVLKNGVTGQIYRLKEGINTFGRDAGLSDFSFPNDSKMSRRHFSVEVSKNSNRYEYFITDLESSNGTIVGNMVLTNKYAYSVPNTDLNDREKIVAGNTKLEFII